jgi:fermentation-respiration switch protein FrsA (DUF1100 family)
VLAVTLVLSANYLVSFSIGRASGKSNIAPKSNVSQESVAAIVSNWQYQRKQAEEWIQASETEKVEVQSEDGLTLRGELFLGDENSHRWLIAVHGYRGDHGNLLVLGSYYGLNGYNVLLPDLRGCGESDGEYIGMGWLDRKDMLRWIDLILKRDSEAQIVLHGISMGGATVMMTSGEALPSQVKAIVEDCGYTSVWDIFEDEMAYLFHLPAFPLLHVASAFSSIRAGYSFSEASSLKQLAGAKVPMLFIHGSLDNFVHTEMVYKVYDACPTEKRLLIVEGAGHGFSHCLDPETYFDAVFDFIAPYVN